MKILTTVFTALLIDILAFTIILPLFPKILEQYENRKDQDFLFSRVLFYIRLVEPATTDHKRLDIILFGGLLGSLFSFLQYITSPVIGKLSDKYGRRKVLLWSMLGNILSMLLWLFSSDFLTFVMSRVVGGLTEGNVQMSIAMISDVTDSKTRSRGMALVGIAFALGFTIGPLLGALCSQISVKSLIPSQSLANSLPLHAFSGPALFAIVLLSIETLFIYAYLPETRDFGKKNDDLKKKSKKVDNAKLGKLSRIHLLFLLIFSGFEFTLTFLTHDRFKFNSSEQGKLLGFMGITSALLQGGLVRRVQRNLMVPGLVACTMGLLLLASSYQQSTLYSAVALLAFTSATVSTSLNSAASNLIGSDSHETGKFMGKFRASGQLGRTIGPFFACWLYWTFGSTTCYLISATLVGLITSYSLVNFI